MQIYYFETVVTRESVGMKIVLAVLLQNVTHANTLMHYRHSTLPTLYDTSTSFFNWCSGCGVQLGPLGTATTNGLLCQPPVIMMMEKLVE
jgi:hypothetical protein